jgi:phosphatidylglycerol:prolipoprotein diacylglycerol transferase
LFLIPHQWLGLPLFGFGWLLILWAVGSVLLLAWLYRRHGCTSETLGYLPVLLVFGAVIAFVLPILEQNSPGEGLPIRGYGVMLLLAVVAGVGLAARQATRMGLHADTIYSLAFWVFIGGIVGARAFYVFQYWDQFQRDNLTSTIGAILNVTEGGLVVYGSFLGGLIAAVGYVVTQKLPALAIADLVTPSLLLGLAIGRIGCLLNGCCYGGRCETDWLGIQFPDTSPVFERQHALGELYGFRLAVDPSAQRPQVAAVYPNTAAEAGGLRAGATIRAINDVATPTFDVAARELAGAGPKLALDTDENRITITLSRMPVRSLPVHPAQIYSATNAGLLCLLLWAYYPFRRRDGEVFATLLVLYPVTRILLEIVRTDESGKFGTGLTISQVFSIILLIAAACLWVHILRQPRGSKLPLAEPR